MSGSSPSVNNISGSYVFVILAGIAAWQIYTRTDPAPLIVNADTFSVFAPFYIAAQAIERFLEPAASRWNPTTSEKADLKQAKEKKVRLDALPAASPATPEQITKANEGIKDAELALAKAKASRAIPLWAVASIIGL